MIWSTIESVRMSDHAEINCNSGRHLRARIFDCAKRDQLIRFYFILRRPHLEISFETPRLKSVYIRFHKKKKKKSWLLVEVIF